MKSLEYALSVKALIGINQGKEKVKWDFNMTKYITAYDPIIKKRVVHIVEGGWAISLVTGHRFRYRG